MTQEMNTSHGVSVAPADGGGSAAAQAFRSQQLREAAADSVGSAGPDAVRVPPQQAPAAKADAPDAEPQPAPFAKGSDARTAERKKVSGRARVVMQGAGASVLGKMVDISVNGACVMLDAMVPVKKMCTLECDIFQNGTRRVFNVPAVSVYGVLASGHGFKIGFQFGPRSAAALKTIADIMR